MATTIHFEGRQYRLDVTDHALRQIITKGVDSDQILRTAQSPRKIYRSGSHPNQHRIVGGGLCLVGEFRKGAFVLITVYEDSVLTPPRPDQLQTPEGRRYAERFAAGLGRG